MYNVDLGIFERRKNNELQRLYNKPNICQHFNNKKLEWAGQKDVL